MAGLAEAADTLESRTSVACTTSSEWLGEVGVAIHDFLKRERGRVPADVERHLARCLEEIGKVWPKLGRLD